MGTFKIDIDLIKLKDREIEQLRKEKEWLLNSYAVYRGRNSAYKTEVNTKVDILSEMQQALKDNQ